MRPTPAYSPSPLESDPQESRTLPTHYVEHAGLKLHSAFQPIISVAHSKVVGHEALLRGYNEREQLLSPAELFPQLVATLSARQVNETCARLHLGSFAKRRNGGWLFLNVSPDSMPDRAGVIDEFGAWMKECGVRPHEVVVEIIETRTYDECLLAEAVSGFRHLGCLVAIDDFGAGESNFERVWRIRPDLVKLDRAMISEASVNPVVQRILPGIVSLVHEAGSLVVMEGIETERQALIAVESDVDFVQGYYFSRPSTNYLEPPDIQQQFEQLSNHIRSTREERHAMDRGYFASFTEALQTCVTDLSRGQPLHDAARPLLSTQGVQRLYELDAEGYQVGENAEAIALMATDPRYLPCADARGANWFRRPYFQRAMSSPGRVQVSRPYLSIRDARSCVTLSVAFEYQREMRVLCADLDYESLDSSQDKDRRESGVRLKA
jgi:EAL domain-containing protein (putative c-di-GMP-specific phosphodiesterase class I)